ncbi:MAG: hypothetical protein K6U11_09810 [bacterium]|nr:hypothetical protein [bacterium]
MRPLAWLSAASAAHRAPGVGMRQYGEGSCVKFAPLAWLAKDEAVGVGKLL